STDGTYSIQQPLIAPLYGGRSDIELLAQLSGARFSRGHPLVRATLRELLPSGDLVQQWKSGLYLGLVRDLAVQPLAGVGVDTSAVAGAVASVPVSSSPLSTTNIEVNFAADPGLYDGRHANNPWMLEVPDPLSCVSWDNAAY